LSAFRAKALGGENHPALPRSIACPSTDSTPLLGVCGTLDYGTVDIPDRLPHFQNRTVETVEKKSVPECSLTPQQGHFFRQFASRTRAREARSYSDAARTSL